MGKFTSIITIIPMWFLAMLYLCYILLYRIEAEAVDDWRLHLVVNNCSDSAIEEMLEASDLGMDYARWGDFNADPDLALDDYIDTFLLNYNLPLTDENREMVKAKYIQVFCVAAYDGYYVYDIRKTETGGYDLVGSPKIPYMYRDESVPGRLTTYAMNLGGQKALKLQDATITNVDNPLSYADTMVVVNNRISDDLRERVDRSYQNGWMHSVYVPSDLTTIASTNAIKGPTVLCFMDNVDLNSVNKVNAFGIGGSRATVARPVSVYKRKNNVTGEWVKYYCYHDLLPEGYNDASIIEDVYMSIDEAAAAGYHPDLMFMR